VVGSGETHTVQEFVEVAFARAGLDWQRHVVVDPKFYRPAEVDLLLADPAKANHKLGWRPMLSFKQLVHLMVDEDLAALSGKTGLLPLRAA
jgi:GDPmannose 4,6-dehydratase